MPFKSESQRKFMWAKHPKIAKKWAKKYGSGKGLPFKLSDELARRKVKRK